MITSEYLYLSFLLFLLYDIALGNNPTASPSPYPTEFPTFSPRPITRDILPANHAAPIAIHQLIVVPAGGSTLVKLKGYDTVSNTLIYNVVSLPLSGSLHQLSQIFSAYGYEPMRGTAVTLNSIVTGSNNRVLYSRPINDVASTGMWGSFSYTVTRGSTASQPGTVTLVPPSGAIVGSDFQLDGEGWAVFGNKAAPLYNATFEPFNRGSGVNHFIHATDDIVNTAGFGQSDRSLWFFQAPSKFLGNRGISYGGSLSFTLLSFSGDFSSLNSGSDASGLHVVVLECMACTGPVGLGVRLAFPLSALAGSAGPGGNNLAGGFVQTGSAGLFKLPLRENAGWLKDPQNTLGAWTAPSKCDFIQVLSRLSALRILGDWTSWYESVALDNVVIANTQAQLPVCAMGRPDGSTCDCV